jgi:hypothetical protein
MQVGDLVKVKTKHYGTKIALVVMFLFSRLAIIGNISDATRLT